MAKPKPIRGIDCDATAADAIRLVVTTRMGEMYALRDQALDWSNPKGIHDMRVASRRLRSALHDFIPYLRKRRLTASLRGIKAIADALGEVRDQDVAIIALDKLATKAPPEVSPGIQLLTEGRRAKRDRALKELTAFLDQDRLAQLRSEFLKALDGSLTPPHGGKRPRQSTQMAASSLTYRQVGRATILDRLKEFEKLGDSLYHPLKAKPLHQMRIAAKRLRYALGLFEQCWGKPVALFARRVAALQSELGELHDCDVWIVDFGDDLEKVRKQARPAQDEDVDRSVASLWLLAHFVKLRTRHYRKALSRWREWEANDFSGQLRKSIANGSSVAAITTSKVTIAATETAGVASAQDL